MTSLEERFGFGNILHHTHYCPKHNVLQLQSSELCFLLQKQPDPALLPSPPQIPDGLRCGLSFGLTLCFHPPSYSHKDKAFYVCTQTTSVPSGITKRAKDKRLTFQLFTTINPILYITLNQSNNLLSQWTGLLTWTTTGHNIWTCSTQNEPKSVVTFT